MRGDSTDGATAMSDGMFGKRIGLAVACARSPEVAHGHELDTSQRNIAFG